MQHPQIWLGGSALCDSILAACMIYYLQRAKTGFRTTTTLLSKFIRITVETGLTCAIFAILDLSLDLAFKKNNYHLAPSIALSKIYANSLLVVRMISHGLPVQNKLNRSKPGPQCQSSYRRR